MTRGGVRGRGGGDDEKGRMIRRRRGRDDRSWIKLPAELLAEGMLSMSVGHITDQFTALIYFLFFFLFRTHVSTFLLFKYVFILV